MIDIPKKKTSKSSLGVPPTVKEVSIPVLESPEIAPHLEAPKKQRPKTRRTVQLALKVTPEFDKEVRKIMFEKNIKYLPDLFEAMLNAYKKR